MWLADTLLFVFKFPRQWEFEEEDFVACTDLERIVSDNFTYAGQVMDEAR